MKWYPWLNTTYRQILSRYQKKCGHHALLLQSQPGNGEVSLCYALSRWLICRRSNGGKSCGVCHSCRLMIAGNHPDFYQLEPEKWQQTLGANNVRTIISGAYGRARHGGAKVFYLPHAEQLTEQAANALLKILEEPPENTYFLLVCETPSRLLPTMRSRCLYWPLPAPDEAVGLRWLRQSGHYDLPSSRTALRLCANAPLAAEDMLQPASWKIRMALCTALQDALINGDFLALLPVLKQDKDNKPVYWLLSLLADALKWQQKAQEFLINADKTSIVISLAARWPAGSLHVYWQLWLQYLRQCKEISGVNRELLLTHHLLNWE